MTLTVTEKREFSREEYEKADLNERTMILFDFMDQFNREVNCKLDSVITGKKDAGDCISVSIGKGRLKLPISPDMFARTKLVFKAVGYGTLAILLLTGQVNINSPLVKDILSAMAKIVTGG